MENLSDIIYEDVTVIGSGPAGYTAAIYLARANLNPLVVTGFEEGGQLMITTDVENFPGFKSITGPDLMSNMKEHAKAYGSKLMITNVTSVDFSKRPFTLKTSNKKTIISKSVIIATGASAKWLGLESEKFFSGFGVSACATCDGTFFKDKKVAVIGGGNTAAEESLYLTRHASKVTLIHRRNSFRSEPILQDRIKKEKKIELLTPYVLEEITGSTSPKSVTGLRIKNMEDSSVKNIDVDGVFIAIGHKPNTDLFANQLELDDEKYIKIKPGTSLTSIDGVFAAGDVHDKIYRQAITAAGSGCIAALDAAKFLSDSE